MYYKLCYKASVKGKNGKYHEKKLNLMQIHLPEVKILQIHNARPEFVKKKKYNCY